MMDKPTLSLLAPSTSDRAIDIAVAALQKVYTAVKNTGRLSHPPLPAKANQERFRNRWNPMSLASGHSGIAVAFGVAATATGDSAWLSLAHEQISAAAASLGEYDDLPLGLHGGLTGLAFAAHCLSSNDLNYQSLFREADPAICAFACELSERVVQGLPGVTPYQIDAISGLSGLGAYLLGRPMTTEIGTSLRSILEAVTAIGAFDDVAAWRTEAHRSVGSLTTQFPLGYVDLGLAHGVSGLISLASLAADSAVRPPQLLDANRLMCDWVIDHCTRDKWGISWPPAIPANLVGPSKTADRKTSPYLNQPTRTAWCYGTPGVAAALRLAGRATGDERYTSTSHTAIYSVLRRPQSERFVNRLCICHGRAGLLHIAATFARDQRDLQMLEFVEEITQSILDDYDPQSPIGFGEDATENDQLGLLEGTAGVAMVLLGVATGKASRWGRALLVE